MTLRALDDLHLQWKPVAIGFMATAPAGLPRLHEALPAGCAYWKHASEGHAFYTTPEDHFNCPIGAFTHGASLPVAKQQELEGLIGTMIALQYLKSDEVASIPHRSAPLQLTAYAPLADAAFAPDVVVIRGSARQMMLVSEAARSAGVFDGSDVMGRPACAMIPHAIDTGRAVASFGCIGNRVYTGLADGELYVAVPGKRLAATLERLAAILSANAQLETFHQQRNR
jgi:uncharacterized protein (DUF169 family)